MFFGKTNIIFLDAKHITIYFFPHNFILIFQELFHIHFTTLKFFDALVIR